MKAMGEEEEAEEEEEVRGQRRTRAALLLWLWRRGTCTASAQTLWTSVWVSRCRATALLLQCAATSQAALYLASSCCYICVLVLIYLCLPHTAIYVSSYCYMCPHTAIYVASYCYICGLILLYMCPRTAICVLILLYVCPHTAAT
jgi:hypothetical protein